MRWLIEVMPLGSSEKESLRVEADTWQKALQAARTERGETGSMSGFTIELLDEGCRATDAMSRLSYEVRRSPDEEPTRMRTSSVRPSAAPKVVFTREAEPTEAVPLTYREYVYAVPAGTSEKTAEALLLAQLKIVRTTIEAAPKGKLVNLAVVDAYDAEAKLPPDKDAPTPLATLRWKDWRGEPLIGFPRRSTGSPASTPSDGALSLPPPPADLVHLAEAATTPAPSPDATIATPASLPDASPDSPSDADARPAARSVPRPSGPAPQPVAAHTATPAASPASASDTIAVPAMAAPTPAPPVALSAAVSPALADAAPTAAPPVAPDPLGSREASSSPATPPQTGAQAAVAAPAIIAFPVVIVGSAPVASPQKPVRAVSSPDLDWPDPPQAAPPPGDTVAVAPVGAGAESAPKAAIAAPEVATPATEVAPAPAAASTAPHAIDPATVTSAVASAVTTSAAATSVAVASSAETTAPSVPVSPSVSAAPPAPSRETEPPPASVRLHGEDLITDLFEAMHELHFLPDALEAGDFCLTLAMQKLPSRAGIVHLYDINHREFVVTSTRGAGMRALLLRRSPETDVLIAKAMRKRRAIVVPAVGEVEGAAARFADVGGAQSLIVAPAMQAGRFLGVIELVDPLDGEPFNEAEGMAVTYIAEQLAEFVAQRGPVTDPERIQSRRSNDAA